MPNEGGEAAQIIKDSLLEISQSNPKSLNNEIAKIGTIDRTVVPSGFAREYSNIIEQLSDAEDIIFHKECKLCHSEFRTEAEQQWERKNKNSVMISNWLNDEKKFTISTIEVTHHMNEHYCQQANVLRLREYGNKIGRILRAKNGKMDLVDNAVAICHETMVRIAILDTKNDIKKEKARADSLAKIMSQMVSLIDLQVRLQQGDNPLETMKQRFVQVWLEQVKKSPPELQQVMIKMLDNIQSVVDPVPEEKKT